MCLGSDWVGPGAERQTVLRKVGAFLWAGRLVRLGRSPRVVFAFGWGGGGFRRPIQTHDIGLTVCVFTPAETRKHVFLLMKPAF